MVHVYVKFGDPNCIGFCDIVYKNRKTNKQTNQQTRERRRTPYQSDCR